MYFVLTTITWYNCLQVLLGVVKFGFVGMYLSEPLVRAYTTAAAAHAVVAQLKNIFGVSPKRFNGPLSQVYVSSTEYGAYLLHFLFVSVICDDKES